MVKRFMIALATTVALVGPAAAQDRLYGGCDLEIDILEEGAKLHVLERCAGVKTYHEDWDFYHPRGSPKTKEYHCKILGVERLDRMSVNVTTYCPAKQGNNKRSVLNIQSTDRTITINNVENY